MTTTRPIPHDDPITPRSGMPRRSALRTLAGGAGALALGAAGAMISAPSARAVGGRVAAAPDGGRGHGRITRYDAQTTWRPMPEDAAAQRDVQIRPGVRLRVWDTGGRGPVIVLLHPYSGSGEVFGYQHAAFARAGYRSISFSRRGFFGSDAGPSDDTGTVAGDLQLLADALDLRRFHLVGTAAGGFGVFDYALSHPERLRSAAVASTLAGISEPDWTAVTTALLPAQWNSLPGAFQELGPSYRAANPDGVAQWQHYEERSKPANVVQAAGRTITWAAVESITTPLLVLSGDADLYMPPSRMRTILEHVRDGEGALISEAGHDPFFEQPDAFNTAILSFIRRR
ncbi:MULTISPECIES: alpha/beta fold hydrolase [unclassified Microbacterium]|uniref:alpha/beta fold hydrolase n=1 Tax=unclassified Microbacterium TaxID=2609290 RepID=UPI003015FDC7